MNRVQILSPFRPPAGEGFRGAHLRLGYAQAAMLDSLERGEAPFAPHMLYPIVLDDSYPEQRTRGISAGLAWLAVADLVAVYTDLGISEGMRAELAEAERLGKVVERRTLDGWAPLNGKKQ